MAMIGPLSRARPVRASMITARARSVTIRIIRRSYRSAAIPAGTESRMYGTIRAAPTIPSTTGEAPAL